MAASLSLNSTAPPPAAHGLHGLQGLLAAQGFIAAQGLHGFFFAAQGLHGLHGFFFAAQGLQGLEARRGTKQREDVAAPPAAQGLHGLQGLPAAQGFLAAHGLHGLHGFFFAAQGLHGLHGFFFAAQGLHGLHGFFFAAQGLQAAARRRFPVEGRAMAEGFSRGPLAAKDIWARLMALPAATPAPTSRLMTVLDSNVDLSPLTFRLLEWCAGLFRLANVFSPSASQDEGGNPSNRRSKCRESGVIGR